MSSHEIEIRVRYSEADPMGFLHHSRFVVYFEMGRIELLRATGGSYREIEERGLFIVMVKLTTNYHRPARFDDVLTLRTSVTRVSLAKLEHSYELRRGDELIATASSVMACVDREGVVQPIPDALREEASSN